MVFIAAPLFLNAFFFSDFEGGPGRAMSYQYMSVVMASILGVVVIFRGRLIKRTQADDAEQLVGPERR